jgi:hypothetical protein
MKKDLDTFMEFYGGLASISKYRRAKRWQSAD